MTDTFAATESRFSILAAVGRRHQDDHAGQPLLGHVRGQQLAVGLVVTALRPRHRRALGTRRFQAMLQIGRQRVAAIARADEQPGPRVDVIHLWQLALLPFDGHQPLAQQAIRPRPL